MLLYIFLLALSTTIWGYGFIASRLTFESFDPYWSHALRFMIAGIIGLPFLIWKKYTGPKMGHQITLKEGLLAGFLLTGTLLFQTIGLSYTTVAKSGFITTLYSFFVPLTMMIVYKKKFRYSFWLLVLMAVIGMGLLCNLEIKDINMGDILMFICSIFASFHIIYIGQIAPKLNSPIQFNLIQNIWVALISIPVAFMIKGPVDLKPLFNIHSNTFKGMLFLSIISSLIAFSIQVIAQKRIPSHIAGLIFLLESPFAALFAFYIFNERLNVMNLFGASLIILSVILVPVLGREVTTPLSNVTSK